jgi:hypothetical protein
MSFSPHLSSLGILESTDIADVLREKSWSRSFLSNSRQSGISATKEIIYIHAIITGYGTNRKALVVRHTTSATAPS